MEEHAANGHPAAPTRCTVHVIGVHSDRGGSGKTTLAANLAYLLARTGATVAVACRQLFAAERPDPPFTAELERVARHCMHVEAGAGAGS